MIHLERHRLGPRIYVLGRRIHEYTLGLVALAVLLAGRLLGLWDITDPVAVLIVVAAWLVIKDWRDMVPSKRDTAGWSVGLHPRRLELRPSRRGHWIPGLAALVAAVIGIVNLCSALTPNIAWRGHALLEIEPLGAVPLFHALALPASAALIVGAVYLALRRRRAWQFALVLLIAFVPLNLLKGLDIEEALLSAIGAGLLWWGRDAFTVRQAPLGLRSAFWRVLLVAGMAVGLATLVVDARTNVGMGTTLRETGALLLWQQGPLRLHGEMHFVTLSVRLISLSALILGASLLFRPLGGPRRLPGLEARSAAASLLRSHGRDTLSFFKLRQDTHYLFSSDRRAFLGYRVENGVLLVSGDPVGPPDALAGLIGEAVAFAELRGLKLGAVGASAGSTELWRQAGLRSLYLGDEAIVEVAGFSLEGRAIRKIRQSVSRLEKAGFTTETVAVADLDERTLAELEMVSERWRGGAEERGFAMAMDSVRSECRHASQGLVLEARDAEGRVRGFLHFVPTYGRPVMSLSAMRRDPDTPNGLTEFLIVKAIEMAKERGIEELSLNFAAFARFMHAPRNGFERLVGLLARKGDRFFQIESLYRFNAKFSPRWEPRYLLYEGLIGLPRAGLAAAWAEGQIPRPRLPGSSDRAAA